MAKSLEDKEGQVSERGRCDGCFPSRGRTRVVCLVWHYGTFLKIETSDLMRGMLALAVN